MSNGFDKYIYIMSICLGITSNPPLILQKAVCVIPFFPPVIFVLTPALMEL
jgi:hypothetical protein